MANYSGLVLISREEARFDFGSATFDTSDESDRKLLAWILNQFLYGEVTGIQCGYWLYRAPHLSAAAFLARQAGEELSHVRRILRILTLLGEKPAPAHPAVRFLSTGMMGASWGEHVALEMALGEGLVLSAFYALTDTIAEPEIKKILESALVEEERHVEFGEVEARRWLAAHPGRRKLLLGLALLQVFALRWLRGFITRRLIAGVRADHPVLKQFPKFFEHVVGNFEKRIERLGISERPLRELGTLSKLGIVALLPFRKIAAALSGRAPLLTATYLEDPLVRGETERLLAGADHPRA